MSDCTRNMAPPDPATCPHEPDITTLSVEYDVWEVYVDVECKFCHSSGCAGRIKIKPEEIDW